MTAQLLYMPWVIRRGEAFGPVLTYTDTDGNALSLVGKTLTAYIKSGRSIDASNLAVLTVQTIDASAGTYRPFFAQADCEDLDAALIASPMAWGQVWVDEGTDDAAQIVEANPVSVL